MQQQMQQSNLKYKATTKYMRKVIKKWRDEQIAKTPCCYVSGKVEQLEVHHTTSFNQIFRQAHKNLNLQYHKYIFEYSYEEFKVLKAEILRLHEGCEAVVLTHDIHLELHQMYGSDVSMEQIEEYKQRREHDHE